MVFSVGIIFAQEKTVTGKVTAAGEGPLPGINVTVQGTTIGAITDVNGAYSLRVPGPNAVLVFSSIGYLPKQVTVGNQTVVDVEMETDVKALQEVVVTGYSSQRKREITGAVGVVETDKLTAIPTGNVANQLQGRTSGVTVTGDGRPGATSKVRIRGVGSFESNDPLYIVDGVPTQDISTLNPNDIETMVVLKDAGAASVYGARASNGVIVVNTKKGGKGVKVTYDMYMGTQLPGKGPQDLLDTQGYADLQWLVYDNDATVETHPFYGLSTNASPTIPAWAANTNWFDAITDPAPIQNHDISLSGGNEAAKFFAALGYFDQDGIVVYNYTKKYTARFNSEFSILNNRVKIGENLTMAYRQSIGASNLDEGSPFQMGVYRMQPIVPVTITTPMTGITHNFIPGEWGGTGMAQRLGQASNVVADRTRGKDNLYFDTRFVGNAYVDVKILEGLNFKSSLGGTFYNRHGKGYSFATYERSENVGTPSLSEDTEYWFDWVWTNTLNFNKSFGTSKVNGVLGYEAVKGGIGGYLGASRAGYFSDNVDFRTLNNGATITSASSWMGTPRTLLSQFGKVDYSLMDKYLLSATVRRDGASVFGKDNRFGIFPSFSAGWRISEEAFLQGVSWISDLKLRGSYGTMGNQLAVRADNQFYTYGGGVSDTNYDIAGTGSSSMQGFGPARIGNPAGKWETNITTNIGFEGQFFNDKVAVVFDWYTKKTKDLLFALELPGTSGAAAVPYVNVASMMNKGLDVEVTYKNTFGDLNLSATAIFTTYNNEITEIAPNVPYFDWGGSRIGSFTRNSVGHPVSAFYGYEVIGLFQDAAEVTAAPQQDGAEPGFFRYANTDTLTKLFNGPTPGSKVRREYIGDTDRKFIGDPNPDFTYGLNLSVGYKAFDLSAFFYGSQGNDIFNYNKWWTDFWPSFQGQKSTRLLNESWTATNTGAVVPKASNKSNFSTNTQSNSYYLEDGSFLRLKNLQIGYKLPQSLLNKANIKSLRVYVQGINLLTMTKYSGLDPELGGSDTNFGVDSGNYPSVKQFIFGINLVL
jgi:TonB-linked SusC/RagA family outer membrane protein